MPDMPKVVRSDDELRAMSDEELVAHVTAQPYDKRVPDEMQLRLLVALKSFKDAADRSSATLNTLTKVLVFLTFVLVVLTGALVVDALVTWFE